MLNWGAATKYDFDNPEKWFTDPSVPLLDEHEMTDEAGKPVAYVDRNVLQQIADNNNKRIVETGDPATLILGHTSEDPRAQEKPAVGFAVNYHVKPFKRDPKTGQVIYAIHGDMKFRHQNSHLSEKYPRRSVELWWNKKELDPIALLGGTSPERDLGVVIRKARLKHLALLGSSVPERDMGTTIRFSRHGNDVIESYQIENLRPIRFKKDKVEKVMSEFKHGELHSGSKSGPKVTSRKQAVAIAMNEAGKSKYASEENTEECMPKGYPPERARYEMDGEPERYAADDPIDDPNDEFDPGQEGMDSDDMDTESDPMVAKVFQSKQWKELSSKLDQILAALQPEQGAGDGMGGMPGEEPGMDEMPPPGGGGAGMGGPPGMQAPPPGAEAMGDDGMGMGDEQEQEPAEEERLMHGQKPVKMGGPTKMSSTGFAGPNSTYSPSFVNGAKNRPFKRSRPSVTPNDSEVDMAHPDVIRLQRRLKQMEEENKVEKKQNGELRLRYARSQATQDVESLASMGIQFGETPQEEVGGKEEEIAHLTNVLLHEGQESYDAELDHIQKRYRRRPANPANPSIPGAARYARGNPTNSVEDPEEYEPRCPQEATDLADLQYGCYRGHAKKYSKAEAVAFVKKKEYAPFDVNTGH